MWGSSEIVLADVKWNFSLIKVEEIRLELKSPKIGITIESDE
jgi:hypothetical protein